MLVVLGNATPTDPRSISVYILYILTVSSRKAYALYRIDNMIKTFLVT